MGLKEQIVFPEIDYDKVDEIRGMDIVICTTAKTDDEARALLKGFDMPFRAERAARRTRSRWLRKARSRRTSAERLVAKKYAAKRAALKAIANDETIRRKSASRRA